MYTCVGVNLGPAERPKEARTPGVGVTSCSEPLDAGAESQGSSSERAAGTNPSVQLCSFSFLKTWSPK